MQKKHTSRKIVLIGAGAVGTSFLYSAMNQGLAAEYGLIDMFETPLEGNVMDLEDASPSVPESYRVYKTDYDHIGDADLIVITAGRPQKDGETRLEMVADNVKVIEDIAEKVKKSGFKGITLIASNPVDIITYAYLQKTGFDPKRVIGSGTVLDTARLKMEIAKRLDISPKSVTGYVIGEHGDSSLVVYSKINVSGVPFDKLSAESGVTADNYEAELETYVYKKAYEIIKRKRATFYGIGAALAQIARNIFADSHAIMVVGANLNGEYGHSGLNIGVPVVLSGNGIERIIELDLNEKEQAKFNRSVEIVKKVYQDAKK
ncbi:L-lactate dehydrogenase [Candidatus Mycoplasma pogonae]